VCRLSGHILRIVPVLVLVSVILSLPSCDFIRKKLHFGKYSLQEAIEWARADSVRIADSVKKVIADKKVFERTLTDSIMTIEQQDIPEERTAQGYYIIIGTFANHNNALLAAEKYTTQGFNTAIVPVTGKNGAGLELVSVKTFTMLSEAQEFLKGFRGIYDQGAWIHKVR
jgi:hypothetical protein